LRKREILLSILAEEKTIKKDKKIGDFIAAYSLHLLFDSKYLKKDNSA